MKMIRNTRQREAILGVITVAGRPLTVPEIYALGREKSARLGLRTVYRNIRQMVEEERLVGLDYPGQPTRYELVDGRYRNHFICSLCQKMFDFTENAPEVVFTPPAGFKITGQEVIFYGVCPDCSAKAPG